MQIITFIQKYGFKKFLIDGLNELLKKYFCIREKCMAFIYGKTLNTYAQYCEDLFIVRFFKYKKNISYIDVGAHSPDFLSNTKKIYEEYEGKGVNIEANPELITEFYNKRKNDKNLNIGIGTKGILPFGICIESPLSSFHIDTIEELRQRGLLKEMVNVEVVGLSDIFDRFSIDFDVDLLSVDVEGSNLEVLKTNDWYKCNPKLICVENDASYNTDITMYLADFGYKKIAYNGLNTFYTRKSVK